MRIILEKFIWDEERIFDFLVNVKEKYFGGGFGGGFDELMLGIFKSKKLILENEAREEN